MTSEQFKSGRKGLGMTQFQMAQSLNLGPYGRKAIMRWESGATPIPGAAQVAMRFMLRDAGITLETNNEGK